MSLVGLHWRFPDWERKFHAAERELNLFVAASLQTNRGMMFDQEGGSNGHPKWAGLVLRNGMILSRRGTLRKSMAPYQAKGQPGPDGIVRFGSETVTIGTRLLYARMMNDGTAGLPGGVLRPVHAKALAIPLPAGKAATEAAKELRKKSVGRQGLQDRLNDVLQNLDTAHDPDRRQRLMAMEVKLRRKLADTPKNQRVMFRKSVRIPARPMDRWNARDQQELEAALTAKITEILNR